MEGPGLTDIGGGCLVIGNGGGGGKEWVRSSAGRSFQRRGATFLVKVQLQCRPKIDKFMILI